VRLKYEGLAPWEIWLSEAQERMVLALQPENLEAMMELCEAELVEATVLGEFTDSQKLRVSYGGNLAAELDMYFLHEGLPTPTKKAVWEIPCFPEPPDAMVLNEENGGSCAGKTPDFTQDLCAILRSPNVASKEWVIRQYDHEVQGGVVLKPLVGVENDGPSDACIVTPVLGSRKGVIVSNGINPKYSDIDPYHSAAAAIDEALRNVIAVGGKLESTALLDNFSWGNPDKPDRLGGLVRAAKACYDIATAYGTPFISGKDSLYNEYRDTTTGKQLAIPSTLLISACCIIPDVTKAITMDAKSPGNLIYVLGKTYDELGASHYYDIHGFVGNNVPTVRANEGKRTMTALSRAIEEGLIYSCHDCSEGGIGVAAAEMAFSGGFGMKLDLTSVPRDAEVATDDVLLFAESNSRFIVEISRGNRAAFEERMDGVPFGCIGRIVAYPDFIVRGISREKVVSAEIYQLKEAWQSTFREGG
jgi:phosphoribosylformylglycinamidine synthase